MDISGKVALITGGASGLGLATAKRLLSSGAKIMLVDLNEENVKKAAESLGDPTAFAIANVTEEDSVQNCIETTKELEPETVTEADKTRWRTNLTKKSSIL